jgi:hypothetical protein
MKSVINIEDKVRQEMNKGPSPIKKKTIANIHQQIFGGSNN